MDVKRGTFEYVDGPLGSQADVGYLIVFPIPTNGNSTAYMNIAKFMGVNMGPIYIGFSRRLGFSTCLVGG